MQAVDTIAMKISGRPLNAWRYVARHRIEKLRLGLKYGLGLKLTRAEGATLLYDAETLAGLAILCSIDVDGTLQTAIEGYDYEEHPLLEQYIAEGVEHVRRKWSGNGDMVGEAEQWAIDAAIEAAARDGVTFTETDDWSGQG